MPESFSPRNPIMDLMDKTVSNASADSALLPATGTPEVLIPKYSDDERRASGKTFPV
jgi:hypothetical protein